MHPSVRLLRQPTIKFLGKRSWPSSMPFPFLPFFCFVANANSCPAPAPPHPHPAAPAEVQKSFSEFAKKLDTSPSSSPSESHVSRKITGREFFGEFWEAPSWVRQPRYRELEDAEIDAVLVSSIPAPLMRLFYNGPCRVEVHHHGDGRERICN
jgi:small subunit ribosomal protein YMR-31